MTDHEGEAATGRSRWVKDWAQHGVCIRTAEPDAMFVRGAGEQKAKQVCVRCPVIADRLADSLDNHIEFGLWGGMTERQRRALLKRRPEVKSWSALFEVDRMSREPPPPESLRSGLKVCRPRRADPTRRSLPVLTP